MSKIQSLNAIDQKPKNTMHRPKFTMITAVKRRCLQYPDFTDSCPNYEEYERNETNRLKQEDSSWQNPSVPETTSKEPQKPSVLGLSCSCRSCEFRVNMINGKKEQVDSELLSPTLPPFQKSVEMKPEKKPIQLGAKSEIQDVWQHNVEGVIATISSLVDTNDYNIISFDTEFPGIIEEGKRWVNGTLQFKPHYEWIRSNVNNLNLIQVGITLANDKGRTPKPRSTWQFNMRFDESSEVHNPDSIRMLKNAGLNFDRHRKDGIDQYEFAKYLKSSGLLENKNLTWVAFNSSFDFAYMLKILDKSQNGILPNSQYQFLKQCNKYFPNFYDVKLLEISTGSLAEQAYKSDIKWEGNSHQAGSDSLVTMKLFVSRIPRDCNCYEQKKWKKIEKLSRNQIYKFDDVIEIDQDQILKVNQKFVNLQNRNQVYKYQKQNQKNRRGRVGFENQFQFVKNFTSDNMQPNFTDNAIKALSDMILSSNEKEAAQDETENQTLSSISSSQYHTCESGEGDKFQSCESGEGESEKERDPLAQQDQQFVLNDPLVDIQNADVARMQNLRFIEESKQVYKFENEAIKDFQNDQIYFDKQLKVPLKLSAKEFVPPKEQNLSLNNYDLFMQQQDFLLGSQPRGKNSQKGMGNPSKGPIGMGPVYHRGKIRDNCKLYRNEEYQNPLQIHTRGYQHYNYNQNQNSHY